MLKVLKAHSIHYIIIEIKKYKSLTIIDKKTYILGIIEFFDSFTIFISSDILFSCHKMKYIEN